MIQRWRRKTAIYTLVFVWCSATSLLAADSIWKRIRYEGGTIEAQVNPFDWNTTLKVDVHRIELTFAGQKTVTIAAAEITSLSYGEKAFRRVSDVAARRLIVKPLALFGVLHKSTDHLIGIQFKTSDGKTGGVLLNVHKAEYSELVERLHTLTGKPVENWP